MKPFSKKELALMLIIIFVGVLCYLLIVTGYYIFIAQSTKALMILNGIYYIAIFVSSMIAGYIIRKFIEPKLKLKLKFKRL